jgi:hypothetical protein
VVKQIRFRLAKKNILSRTEALIERSGKDENFNFNRYYDTDFEHTGYGRRTRYSWKFVF